MTTCIPAFCCPQTPERGVEASQAALLTNLCLLQGLAQEKLLVAIQEHTRRLNHCLSESALHSDSWYHDRLAESSAGGLLHLLAGAWGRTSLSSPRPRPPPSGNFVDTERSFSNLDDSCRVILENTGCPGCHASQGTGVCSDLHSSSHLRPCLPSQCVKPSSSDSFTREAGSACRSRCPGN